MRYGHGLSFLKNSSHILVRYSGDGGVHREYTNLIIIELILELIPKGNKVKIILFHI